MVAPPVTFSPAGDTLSVCFNRFDPEAYDLFLRVKRIPEYRCEFNKIDETYTISAPARFAELLGVERPARAGEGLPYHSALHDDQVYVVRTAVDAKRYAIWSDCGWGKTLAGLEWARQVSHTTGGRVLVVTVNEVVNEWIREAGKWYGDDLPVHRIESREEMRSWCAELGSGIGVTNYEKFNHKTDDQVVNEVRSLAGIIVDENRLKTGGGKQKWALIKSTKGIEYKLSLTATPAPNNAMEFASQASFLEKMRSDKEVIWTYFSKDATTGEWTVRPHARAAFYEWMASWSIYIRDPKRYGWRCGQPDVPAPEYIRVEIDPTPAQLEASRAVLETSSPQHGQPQLFAVRSTSTIERTRLSEVAKGFLYQKRLGKRTVKKIATRKPAEVVRIVAEEVARGSQVLVWTVFDAESKILANRLKAGKIAHKLLTGSTSEGQRADILEDFRNGLSVLVSRASLLGFGMNFQCVQAMVFSGWSDSYERFYQAVRRAVRQGQLQRVRIYLPFVRELEDETLANLDVKAVRMESAISEMESRYVQVLRGNNR